MSSINSLSRFILFSLLLISVSSANAADFTSISPDEWDEVAVRKVLHIFAYGGLATDDQITDWVRVGPQAAIEEMLDFSPINEKLSPRPRNEDGTPTDDLSTEHGGSLKALQDYWTNIEGTPTPLLDNQKYNFTLTKQDGNGEMRLNGGNLARIWLQAINTRGVNPFRHKVGFYLTNYHMALTVNKANVALMRDLYDNSLLTLDDPNKTLVDVLAEGAVSAAAAKAYAHRYNRYNNNTGIFYGNDDFAREFHQLFFKIQGVTEIQDYHENVTIEHTAWALTGMQLDRVDNKYGSEDKNDWFIPEINYLNHDYPLLGEIIKVNNVTNHFQWDQNTGTDCLAVYDTELCSSIYPTANEKIRALAEIAGNHQESLDNMPIAIIDFFADDNLAISKDCEQSSICTDTESLIREKIIAIRSAWDHHEKNLLGFLRAYAISPAFHNPVRVKYLSAFDRNLSIQNQNVLTNEELFIRKFWQRPEGRMRNQGAEVFYPAHDVFGGQTGLQAANNPNILRDAYQQSVENPGFMDLTYYGQTDDPGGTWYKDWSAIAPNTVGEYIVADVARWLWDRFVNDGGKNYSQVVQVQLHAILARGLDFGYRASQDYPGLFDKNQVFTITDLTGSELQTLDQIHSATKMNLLSDVIYTRRVANQRIGMAVNFIIATPYVFAQEGR